MAPATRFCRVAPRTIKAVGQTKRTPMTRRGYPALMMTLGLGASGCSQPAPRPEYVEVAANLAAASQRPPSSIHPDDPMAAALDPAPAPAELTGPQPVDVYVRQALAENRAVQSARFNVLAMKS